MQPGYVFDQNFPCYGGSSMVVSIVGYDGDTFIVRNSWGTGFGDGGYFRISSPASIIGPGTCGILNRSFFPVIRYLNVTL